MSAVAKPPSDISVRSLVSDQGMIRNLAVDTLIANNIITNNENALDFSDAITPSVGVTINMNNSKIISDVLVAISLSISFSDPLYFPSTALPVLKINPSEYCPKAKILTIGAVEYSTPAVAPAIIKVDTNGEITLLTIGGAPPTAPDLPVVINLTYVL